ncbi:AcrR family transcriptional regulator [Geodermatophilus bullaregiensis]|uniref:TetR/AcrR family transcriptional regulator n=1 Tax=Geodermatophilus bullaregiensis TaxID=1564160 RepID=UPI00195D08DF|nr:TetR/AcrR family transcriptional regulator [Geodermatophilus bullaregiensis]MBM7804401.1 AcrR family transcriptional regulator [Geodermatophilus bullaregiensis]
MTSAKRAHLPVGQRRAQLVAAAMQVMQREGAWALTTRAVAREAGVPLGAVHYAFGSKAELVRAVFEADRDRATALLMRAVEAGGTPAEVLTRALVGYADSVIADPGAEMVLQELTMMGGRDDDLRAAARESTEQYRRDALDLLHRVAEVSGGTWAGDVDVLAESVLGLLFGASVNWLCTGDDALFRRCATDAAQVLAGRLVTGSPGGATGRAEERPALG